MKKLKVEVLEKDSRFAINEPKFNINEYLLNVVNEYREWYNQSNSKAESLSHLLNLRDEFSKLADDTFLIEKQIERIIDRYLPKINTKTDIISDLIKELKKVHITTEDRGALNYTSFTTEPIEVLLNKLKADIEPEEKIDSDLISTISSYLNNCLQKELFVRKSFAISLVTFDALKLHSLKDNLPPFSKEDLEKHNYKSHSYAGELSQEAVKDLTKYRKEFPNLPVNEFFEYAYNNFASCRHTMKDGKKIKVKWGTIRDRAKENYPDIYYGNIEAL